MEDIYNALIDEESKDWFDARVEYMITREPDRFLNLFFALARKYPRKWRHIGMERFAKDKEYHGIIIYGCGHDGKLMKEILELCGYSVMYCYDITDQKVEWIANFPEELFNVKQLFYKTRKYKDNLIFIPLDAKDVHIFNLTSKQFTKIELPRILPTLFTDGRVFGKYLYLFGCRYYGILRVDLESKKIETVDGVLEQIEQGIVMDRKEPLFGLQAVEIEKKVYLPFWQSNRLVEYDMENGICRCYEVGSAANRYYGVFQVKDGLALLTLNDGCVVFWYGEYYEEVVYGEDYSLEKHLCVMDDAVWIIPNRTKKLYKIDGENKKVREF